MENKIALEEHFSTEQTIGDSQEYFHPEKWEETRRRLLDVGERRIRLMDETGIELAIVSLNSPAIQAIPDPKRAAEIARRANDHLAEQVDKRRDRFRAFAALPLQDPDAAAAEAQRCVRDLGFVGALANGFSPGRRRGNGNLPGRSALSTTSGGSTRRWTRPFYLHPRDPIESRAKIYHGHPWLLGSAWAFGVETATHALRLMGSGLFDRHPELQVVLGHLGEGLPFLVWRLDHRIANEPRGYAGQRTFQQYLSSNFNLTTSGAFRTPSLHDSISEIGVDRLLFSTDFPFEEMAWASEWFDAAPISENDRIKIGRTNAARLFRLDL